MCFPNPFAQKGKERCLLHQVRKTLHQEACHGAHESEKEITENGAGTALDTTNASWQNTHAYNAREYSKFTNRVL